MKTKNVFYLLIGLLLFCNSCSEVSREIPQTNVTTINTAKYLIGEQESVLTAKDFLAKSFPLTKTNQEDTRSNIQVIYRSIPTNTNSLVSTRSNTGYESIPVYIINFSSSDRTPRGYVLEIGDRRVANNILAFSESGIYDVAEMPEFEQIFFERVDAYIASEIKNNSELFANDDPCDTSFPKEITSTTDKRCNTNLTWDQWAPGNDNLPACSTNATGRVPAGCVAVAIAQIMAYHEKPTTGSYIHPITQSQTTTSYNWSGIKSATIASSINSLYKTQVANLLAEIGNKVHMKYGCSASTAYDSNVSFCFQNMGYQESTSLISYEFSRIETDINANKPVYISGQKLNTNIGHAWIVEGYKQFFWEEFMVRDCPNNITEKTPTGQTGSNDYLYFNTGWGGRADGYYLATAFKVYGNESFAYTYTLRTITNIRPK